MRDRTASRRYSPQGEEFRRDHARHRAWGLARRHAERLRQLRVSRGAPAACPVDGRRSAPTRVQASCRPPSPPGDSRQQTAMPDSGSDTGPRRARGLTASDSPAARESNQGMGSGPGSRLEAQPEIGPGGVHIGGTRKSPADETSRAVPVVRRAAGRRQSDKDFRGWSESAMHLTSRIDLGNGCDCAFRKRICASAALIQSALSSRGMGAESVRAAAARPLRGVRRPKSATRYKVATARRLCVPSWDSPDRRKGDSYAHLCCTSRGIGSLPARTPAAKRPPPRRARIMRPVSAFTGYRLSSQPAYRPPPTDDDAAPAGRRSSTIRRWRF